MKKQHLVFFSSVLWLFSSLFSITLAEKSSEHLRSDNTEQAEDQTPFKDCPIANDFDFPVGPPDAKGYYNAQAFGKNNHLGDDWNGTGGGNSDLGDPVYAIADGQVTFARNAGKGWGNVLKLCHNIGTAETPVYIESLYGHLHEMDITLNSIVKKGQKIGTIGNANGLYYAHLHLEIRKTAGQSIGRGYAKDRSDFFDPTQFIRRF